MSKIRPPEVRDRMEIEAEYIKSLRADIRENGLINPLLVRPKDGYFEIVAGERRFLAVQGLRWERVSCHVQQLSDSDAAVLRAVENLGRKDLSPIEEARVYARLIKDHGFKIDQVASRVSKTVGVVKRRMDLLRMPEILQEAVHKGEINYGVAEELVRLRDEGAISYYLGFCVDHGATVSVVRQWVNDHHKRLRLKDRDVGGGGGLESPMEVAPTYIACSICHGSVELGKEAILRVCPKCVELIKAALRG